MQNAFNECNRSTYLHRLHSVLPELEAWVRWCYCCAGELRFGPHQIKSSAGVQQGDPLGPLLFSLVLLDLLDQVGQIEGLRLSVWYLDDDTFVGPRSSMVSLIDRFQQLGPTLDLHLNLSKCENFWPSGDQSFPEFPPEKCVIYPSLILGSEEFTEAYVLNKADKVLAMQDHLDDLQDPQVELHLLRSCLGLCKVIFLLRTLPPGSAPEAFKRFDAGLRRSLERITNSSLDDPAWQQASLPISMVGLGLREASAAALPAFVGSRNSTLELALHLLGADPVDPGDSDYLPSGEESQAREQLCLILPDLHSASQRSIQRALDSLSFTSLKASLCLRDQARLNTIASPSAGAWLRALPNPLLGLAMPQQEFCMAIRLWLGTKLFPSPPSPSAAPAGK